MDKPVADFYKPQEKLEELKVQILEAQKRRLNERIRELEQQNQIHMQELVRQMQLHMAEQIRLIKASPLPTPLPAYVPDYQPVIKALKQLVKAFEVVDNRGTTPLHTYQEEHKKRSEATKKRHAATPPEKRKASTLPARMARRRKAEERRERLYSSTVPTKS
jgi:TolA-binding protein